MATSQQLHLPTLLTNGHAHNHTAKKRRLSMSDSAIAEAQWMDDDTHEEIHIPTNRRRREVIDDYVSRYHAQRNSHLGNSRQPPVKDGQDNTRYCYRHRPDKLCRKQADEPTMEQLQTELGTLSRTDQEAINDVWSVFSAAPSKHRNLILQGILAQCCYPQLSFISATVKDLIKIDFLTALPAELSFRILSFLDTASLCKAAQVSRNWRALADDDVVWRKMCEQHVNRKCRKCGWGLPLLERKRLRDEKRQLQLRAAVRGVNEWSPDIATLPEASYPDQDAEPENDGPTAGSGRKRLADKIVMPGQPPRKVRAHAANGSSSDQGEVHTQPNGRPWIEPWKDVYKARFKVGTNWKYGRCSTRIIKGHSNGITCLQFDDNILATGSYDATVKIWDIETLEEIRTLQGHQSGIRCLQFAGDMLFTGSIDKTVKVWNWRTGELKRTFSHHSGGVVGLHFDSNILASGSMDHTVRVYNFSDKSTFSLKGHNDWVNAVKIDIASRTLFSASDDGTVKLWDLDTKQCIKTFSGHVGQVQQVLPLPELRDIEEDIHSEPSEHTSSRSNSPDLHIHGPASTGQGNTDVLPPSWQPRVSPPSPSGTHFFPNDPSRPGPPEYFLTGGLDNTLRLWNVYTGRCIRTFFGHVEGVWAVAADQFRFVSGSEDRTVKVWDPRTGVCERTFVGHVGPVTCVGLSDSRLVTASEDCEVRIYGFKGDA